MGQALRLLRCARNDGARGHCEEPAGDDAISTEQQPAISRPARGERSAAPVLRADSWKIAFLYLQIMYFCYFWRHADVDCDARPILCAAAGARSAPLLFCCYPLFLRLRRRRQSRIPAAKEGRSLIICGKNSRKQRKTAVFGSKTAEMSTGRPLTPALSPQAARVVRGTGDGCEAAILCNQRESPWPDLFRPSTSSARRSWPA